MIGCSKYKSVSQKAECHVLKNEKSGEQGGGEGGWGGGGYRACLEFRVINSVSSYKSEKQVLICT